MVESQVLLANLSGPVIELPTVLGDLDLHNFADLDRVDYETEGRVRLVWISDENGKFRLGERRIRRAVLLFEQVTQFGITPRDQEMPLSEDRSLEDFEVLDIGDEAFGIRFSFQGGMCVEINASTARLLLEYIE